MHQTSKELVRTLFARRVPDRPPFIPYIASAVARLMQVSVKDMFSDATLLANTLQSCQSLFKYDAVVNLYDLTLVAEACGCGVEWSGDGAPRLVSHVISDERHLDHFDTNNIERRGRLGIVFEATKRLVQTIGREVGLVGVVTGPVTLVRHLSGRYLWAELERDEEFAEKALRLSGDIVLKVVRSFCEHNVDAILLVDTDLPEARPGYYGRILPTLKTLYNVARFYNVCLIIQTRKMAPDLVPSLFELPADGFSVGDQVLAAKIAALKSRLLFSGNLASSVLLGAPEEITKAMLDLMEKGGGQSFFIATEEEVPFTTPAASIHRVMEILTKTGSSV